MKLDVKPSFVKMEKGSLDQLVTEVKETIAVVDLHKKSKGSFGLIDIWNIRRNGKSASGMMRR
ncbi:MAG TPA: hypothetical protein VGQ53_15200 [Chitinophagaceae bacterium]|jgi:hypothetical protein|nr:hypothetical protein [Chitinophagaceae bacterium]